MHVPASSLGGPGNKELLYRAGARGGEDGDAPVSLRPGEQEVDRVTGEDQEVR